ncbi:MAG: hypothetical protein Q9219_005946 [cf. Caloplaca sp. 3 TL-2023]
MEKLLRWLSAPDPSTNLNAALRKRHDHTGVWLLESQKYLSWKAAQVSFLWLHGIPGCGKTILSSTVIEELLQPTTQPNVHVAYFFFDFNDSSKQCVDKMLRSLIAQLWSTRHSSHGPLEILYQKCSQGTKQPSIKELETALKDLIDSHETTFIVLDALDECENRGELLDFLENAARWKSSKLQVLMTSRSLKDFQDFCEVELGNGSRLSIDEPNVNNDIRHHVHGVLQIDRRFKRWRNHPDVQSEIENKLMEKAGGMFRWVACQFNALSVCLNLNNLRYALGSLPSTLDETYERILCSIDAGSKRQVLHMLRWLAYSRTPLSIEEVAELVAYDPDDGSKFDATGRLPDPEAVLIPLGNLVVCNNRRNDDRKFKLAGSVSDPDDTSPSTRSQVLKSKVKLAHFSVKEYLLSDRIREGPAAYFSLDEQSSHGEIAKTCLSTLLLYDETRFVEFDAFLKEFPLVRYSVKSWVEHLQHAYPQRGDVILSGSPWHLAVQLLMSKSPHLSYWRSLSYIYRPGSSLFLLPLGYAVLTGVYELVKLMLHTLEDTNSSKNCRGAAQDGDKSMQHSSKRAAFSRSATEPYEYPPLMVATNTGHVGILKLLLEHGADPNIHVWRLSALAKAARLGHLDMMRILLDNSAYVDGRRLATKSNKYTPLMAAVKIGNLEILKLLLEHGANPNIHIWGLSALTEAAREGHLEIIKVLLDNGAHVSGGEATSTMPHYGSTALYEAARRGKTHAVKLLIDRGAMINFRTEMLEETPLVAACRSGHKEVVEILLERGKLLDKTNKEANNGFRIALENDHKSVVQLLLEKVDNAVETLVSHWQTAEDQIKPSDERVVKFLLENGVHTEASKSKLSEYLRWATRKGHESTIRMFIKYQADLD